MAITNILGWSDGLSDNVAKTPLQVYKRVPLAFKCANLVANSVSTAPAYVYRNGDESEWMYKTSLKSLMARVSKDLQLYGKAFVLKLTNGRRQVQNLRRLNPNGMDLRVIGIENGEPLFSFTQTYNHSGKTQTQRYDHHEVIYIRLDSEANDVDPDVYPAKVAFQSGKVMDYLATFGEYYFEAGAMPTTVIGVPEGSSELEVSAFEKWVKRRVSGIRKAFGIIALRGEINAVQLNPPAKDLAIPDLDELNRKRVIDAFGVPEGMVEKSANFASAEVHNKQFWDMTVKPLAELIVDAINEQLFDGTGYEIRLAFEELSIYQEDENKRSAAFRNLVSAGVSIEAAWYTLGFADLPEDMPLTLSAPALPAPEEDSKDDPDTKSIKALKSDISKESAFAYIPLPNNQDVLRLQRRLKEMFVDDRIEWQTAPTLHITLCFAGVLSDVAIAKVASLVNISRFELEFVQGDSISYFDTPNGKALHLRVLNTSILAAIQADVYSAFLSEGHDISEFSLPVGWNPHITLGYLPNEIEIDTSQLNNQNSWLDNVSIETDKIIIGRDDYDPSVVITAPNYVRSVANVPSMFTQLDRWKNKSINRIRQGKSLIFDFESEYIPTTLKASIEGALSEASTADDIRHIFGGAVDLTHSHGEAY